MIKSFVAALLTVLLVTGTVALIRKVQSGKTPVAAKESNSATVAQSETQPQRIAFVSNTVGIVSFVDTPSGRLSNLNVPAAGFVRSITEWRGMLVVGAGESGLATDSGNSDNGLFVIDLVDGKVQRLRDKNTAGEVTYCTATTDALWVIVNDRLVVTSDLKDFKEIMHGARAVFPWNESTVVVQGHDNALSAFHYSNGMFLELAVSSRSSPQALIAVCGGNAVYFGGLSSQIRVGEADDFLTSRSTALDTRRLNRSGQQSYLVASNTTGSELAVIWMWEGPRAGLAIQFVTQRWEEVVVMGRSAAAAVILSASALDATDRLIDAKRKWR